MFAAQHFRHGIMDKHGNYLGTSSPARKATPKVHKEDANETNYSARIEDTAQARRHMSKEKSIFPLASGDNKAEDRIGAQDLVLSSQCNVPYPHWIGDGYCDKRGNYNTAACQFDGGDCCEFTCRDARYTCGVAGWDCKSATADESEIRMACTGSAYTVGGSVSAGVGSLNIGGGVETAWGYNGGGANK